MGIYYELGTALGPTRIGVNMNFFVEDIEKQTEVLKNHTHTHTHTQTNTICINTYIIKKQITLDLSRE